MAGAAGRYGGIWNHRWKKPGSDRPDPAVLWDCFSQAEDTIKGDILYLFGKAGDKRIIPKIEKVLKGSYSEDVMDAAAEALKEIEATEW